MVREIMKDTAFLSQKAEIAVAEDVLHHGRKIVLVIGQKSG